MKTFKKGDIVKYTGTGFLGYDKSNLIAVFESYEGSFDAYINYAGFKVLVSKYDLQESKLKPELNEDGTLNIEWLMTGKRKDDDLP